MDIEKLTMWQRRMARSQRAYDGELSKMDQREDVYRGDRKLSQRVAGDQKIKTPHVRNLTAEIIEAEVNSSIPAPKVTARRKQDELKAKIIEDMIRNEQDRLPSEMINDMMERTVPIQGGAFQLLEWDNRQRTHNTVGELSLSVVHPKEFIPQEGVFTGVEDMDYFFLKLPQTKESIKARYGVDLRDEGEENPEMRARDAAAAEDMVTQNVAYYRNKSGGIGKYSWVNDVELEDLEDYQARRVRRCATCGEAEPLGGKGKGVCRRCGGTQWTDEESDYEEIWFPVQRTDGTMIPGAHLEEVETDVPVQGEDGSVTWEKRPMPDYVPTKIPRYKPNIYPVLLQRNVSVYGQLLGDSDVDKIADQQNTANRIEAKIVDKLVKAGSYLILPADASIPADSTELKLIRPEGPADANMIRVVNLEGDISQDLTYLAQVYEEARQIIGITDSFQGRKDTTATSGKAKEFSANQAAGRLESKRVMKNAAYAALFEAMFKFKLAYADEARPVTSHDATGDTVYEEFNRFDFLEQDENGEWYWNDQFLFSCDTSAPLANNREAMWQETMQLFQSGAFGDPTDLRTLILVWTKMELLHHPGAADTKKALEERLEQEQAMQAQMQQVQQMQAAMPPVIPEQGGRLNGNVQL